MLSIEFLKYFETNPTIAKSFKSVFAADQIPNDLSNNTFIIVNTDNSNSIGKHWRCIFKFEGYLEIFDSLGIGERTIFKDYKFSKQYTCLFNTTAVQAIDSTLCGEFCIYFIFNRFANLDCSFTDVLNDIFSIDLQRNDVKVLHFVNSLI